MKAVLALLLMFLAFALPVQALEHSRSIEFTTQQGTWMSLDVSPDGRTIVFDLLGDIYALPIEGGEAKRLSGGPSFDTQPRFSPDGMSIAFVSDRDGADNLWIMSAAGEAPRKVTNERYTVFLSPEWTPDGTALVASRTGLHRNLSVEMWLHPVDGQTPQLLVGEPSGVVALGAAFGRDSRLVYFSQKPRSAVRPFSEIGEYQLASFDRTTGRIHPQSEATGGGLRPALSPDGKWLVYASRFHADTGLRLRNLATGEESWLTYPVTHDEQESQHVSWDLLPGYAFTPDSKAVIVAQRGGISRIEIPSGQSTAIRFEARVRLELAPLLRAERGVDRADRFRVREVLAPALSPDGKQLAFSAVGRIWVMGLDGGVPTRLTRGTVDEFEPAWSADSRSIYYATWDAKVGGHIYQAAVTAAAGSRNAATSRGGSSPRRLTDEPAMYLHPTPVPSGQGVVAVRMARQAWVDNLMARGMDLPPRSGLRVELVHTQARGPARVLACLSGIGRPHFSAEQDRVYVYQPAAFGRQEAPGLISLNLDGTGETRHGHVSVNHAGGEETADDVLVSPDGKTLLVRSQQQVFRVPMPSAPGQKLVIEATSRPPSRLSLYGADNVAWTRDGAALFSLGATVFVAGSGETREIPVPLEVARDKSPELIALTGARLVTMRGAPTNMIENGVIVVRGDHIEAIGAASEVAIPPGARVVDVSGTVILPGFIDSHAHFNTIQAIRPAQPWEFVTSIAYGVTTVFDPSGRPGVMTHADRVETGDFIGPRLYTTGFPIALEVMQGIRSLDDARVLLTRYGKYYGHMLVKYYAAGNREQRQWLATAASELGLMIASEGNGENRIAIPQILDGYSSHEHYLTMLPLYDDVVQLFARSGTWYTPTLLVTHGSPGGEELFYASRPVHDDPKLARFTPHRLLDRETRRRDQYWQHWMHEEEYLAPRFARSVAAVRSAGGRIGVGGHGQKHGVGLHWEMQLMARGGLAYPEILRAATLGAAENLGLARDLGSLEVGKLADLIVLDADPLADIRATESIRYVMKAGRLTDIAAMDPSQWSYWGPDPVP